MIYQLAKILRDVRTAIDMNATDGALVSAEDVDTLTLDDIIRSKLIDAVRNVEVAAPIQLLDSGHNFADDVYWSQENGHEGTGFAILPDDFMRLVAFKMSDWERAVYTPITETDPLYALQHSRYKGVRGNAQKPVVAIVTRSEGRLLEFFSSNSEEATVEQAVYIPLPFVDGDGGIEICERCYRPVVYYAAGLAELALGNADMGNLLIEQAKTHLT